MTPLGDRASFEVYPFVDGSRRILGSNYGFADPATDFPQYAAWTLDGRLPVERLIDRRIGLDDSRTPSTRCAPVATPARSSTSAERRRSPKRRPVGSEPRGGSGT